MINSQYLQPNIVFRLILSKKLFKKGLEACDTDVDIYNFSHGLISIHDALDNFCGAIANHLGIYNLKQNSSLLTTIQQIEEFERNSNPNFTIINCNEINQLNAVRNGIKHSGNFPNILHHKALIKPIVKFFEKYSLHYFQLEWSEISLGDLIKDDRVKEGIKHVESLIAQGNYEESLNRMAIIKFQVFDEIRMEAFLNYQREWDESISEKIKKLRESNNIFPEYLELTPFSDLYQRANFLEMGISRNLMEIFEELTAKVGINNIKDWQYILKHSNWGEPNWTKEISVFCFEILVDAIVKKQGERPAIMQEVISKLYNIQVAEDFNIYNKEGLLVHTINKGDQRKVHFSSLVAGKWEIFNHKDCLIVLVKEDGAPIIGGYFNMGDEKKIEFLSEEDEI